MSIPPITYNLSPIDMQAKMKMIHEVGYQPKYQARICLRAAAGRPEMRVNDQLTEYLQVKSVLYLLFRDPLKIQMYVCMFLKVSLILRMITLFQAYKKLLTTK